MGIARGFGEEVALAQPFRAEVSRYPVAFAVKGKQYVAVSAGSSLVSGAVNTLIGAKPPK